MHDQAGTNPPNSMCVVLDTNIWRSDLLLRTPRGAALLYALRQSGGRIGLPEIVEREVIKQTIRAGVEAVEQIIKNFRTIEMLIGSRPDFRLPTESDFAACATNRFTELGDLLLKVSFTIEQAKIALEMVIMELPPNGPNREEFRDSAIWASVLELSKTFTMHFVTNDRGFFKDRESKKGLADNILGDIGQTSGSIQVYSDLGSCLSALQDNIPPLDEQRLAATIGILLRADIEEAAENRDFELREMVKFSVEAFHIEKLGILALDFKLTYQMLNRSQDELRNEALLLVSGSCFYNTHEDTISDLRKGLEEFKWLDEQEIPHQSSNAYATGIAVLGRREIPYTFRTPLLKSKP
jgi:hypothetical protein